MSFIYHNSPSLTTSATLAVSNNTMLSSGVTLTVPGNITTTNSGYYTVTGSNGTSYDDLKPASLHVKGNSVFEHDAKFEGNITVKGVDLAEAIKNIEARLNILRPNHKLESEWEELRELGDKYRQLERDMIEKLELVDILKQKS
jgi:hypothetical protein